jgi:molybdopterin synthase catalytic subunit
MSVRVQEADFDLGAEIAALRAGRPNIGAVASFIGTVRDINDGTGVSEMELEHYPGMTEKALADIVSAAMQRWELIDALVIHRVGKLKPQDQIVLVAVASKHRGESFAACEFIMDYLKSEAPFWKKEQTPEGARWVDARVTDDKALARWGIATSNGAASTANQPGASAEWAFWQLGWVLRWEPGCAGRSPSC